MILKNNFNSRKSVNDLFIDCLFDQDFHVNYLELEILHFNYFEYNLLIICTENSSVTQNFLYAKNLLGYSIDKKEFSKINTIFRANFMFIDKHSVFDSQKE